MSSDERLRQELREKFDKILTRLLDRLDAPLSQAETTIQRIHQQLGIDTSIAAPSENGEAAIRLIMKVVERVERLQEHLLRIEGALKTRASAPPPATPPPSGPSPPTQSTTIPASELLHVPQQRRANSSEPSVLSKFVSPASNNSETPTSPPDNSLTAIENNDEARAARLRAEIFNALTSPRRRYTAAPKPIADTSLSPTTSNDRLSEAKDPQGGSLTAIRSSSCSSVTKRLSSSPVDTTQWTAAHPRSDNSRPASAKSNAFSPQSEPSTSPSAITPAGPAAHQSDSTPSEPLSPADIFEKRRSRRLGWLTLNPRSRSRTAGSGDNSLILPKKESMVFPRQLVVEVVESTVDGLSNLRVGLNRRACHAGDDIAVFVLVTGLAALTSPRPGEPAPFTFAVKFVKLVTRYLLSANGGSRMFDFQNEDVVATTVVAPVALPPPIESAAARPTWAGKLNYNVPTMVEPTTVADLTLSYEIKYHLQVECRTTAEPEAILLRASLPLVIL